MIDDTAIAMPRPHDSGLGGVLGSVLGDDLYGVPDVDGDPFSVLFDGFGDLGNYHLVSSSETPVSSSETPETPFSSLPTIRFDIAPSSDSQQKNAQDNADDECKRGRKRGRNRGSDHRNEGTEIGSKRKKYDGVSNGDGSAPRKGVYGDRHNRAKTLNRWFRNTTVNGDVLFNKTVSQYHLTFITRTIAYMFKEITAPPGEPVQFDDDFDHLFDGVDTVAIAQMREEIAATAKRMSEQFKDAFHGGKDIREMHRRSFWWCGDLFARFCNLPKHYSEEIGASSERLLAKIMNGIYDVGVILNIIDMACCQEGAGVSYINDGVRVSDWSLFFEFFTNIVSNVELCSSIYRKSMFDEILTKIIESVGLYAFPDSEHANRGTIFLFSDEKCTDGVSSTLVKYLNEITFNSILRECGNA